MKLPFTLFSFSLAALTAAQANLGLEDAVKGPAVPAPPKAKLPIPPKVNKLPQPPTKPAQKLPSSITPCRYFCPLRDMAGVPLVKKSTAFGWDFDGYFVDAAVGRVGQGKGKTKGKGWYDVFECVYILPMENTKEHTCSYYKNDGTHALGYQGDNCPSQAPACPDTSSPLPVVPILGLPTDEEEDDDSTPYFSSSQLDGAELLDPVRGVYKYKDSLETPSWVEEERIYINLKEHPPAKLD